MQKRNSFSLRTSGLGWVANYDKTRWFLVLRLTKAPNDGLNKLLHATNRTAEEFGQLALYQETPSASGNQQPMLKARKRGTATRGREDMARGRIRRVEEKIEDLSAHFHISIAWTLEAPVEGDSKDVTSEAKDCLDQQELIVDVETVKIKIGNNVNSIALSAKIDTTNGIISH